jgi:3-oxoacyl-[acyl-carrier-protein] synthase II
MREVEQEPQMALAHLSASLGLGGPSMNCMTACAASTQAIGEATEVILRGDADVMVSGGCHSMIHPLGMTGFVRLTAMSTRRDDPAGASRPFDRTRDGFVMGEGAGVLVLEELGHAIARGARPLAEVAGYGSSADAYRITDIDPEGEGAWRAMARALEQAGIDPAALDGAGRPGVHYVSAHGTGTRENDGIETRAVKRVFGEHAGRVPMSSVKSMLGHLIQAAGAVELIACIRSMQTGWLPPTINYHEPDAACDLDYVPNVARDVRGAGGVGVCLSNSFGFGGQNDAVVVRHWDG